MKLSNTERDTIRRHQEVRQRRAALERPWDDQYSPYELAIAMQVRQEELNEQETEQ